MIPRAIRAAVAAALLLMAGGGVLSATTFPLTSPLSATCMADPHAVYSIQNGVLKPVSGRFSIFPSGQLPLQPFTRMPASAAPGTLARFYVWSTEPLTEVTAQVGTPGKTPLTRASGFLASSNDTTEMWAVLVGIPAGSAIKEFTLTLTVKAGERSFLVLRPIAMTARKFFTEQIHLTKELTTLATTPDVQKTVEARSLADVLVTPHADAVFATQAFQDPLQGARRTAGYGDRREYLYSDGSDGVSTHQGVDIASPPGTPVPACARGRVVFAQSRILTGNTVVIEHLPGLFSIYYHMSALIATEGDVVDAGDIVGLVGMTGFATGPHLHWEVQSYGVAVDPDSLVTGPLLDKNADFIDSD